MGTNVSPCFKDYGGDRGGGQQFQGGGRDEGPRRGMGRGLHSSTSQLNLSRFGHTSPCPPV